MYYGSYDLISAVYLYFCTVFFSILCNSSNRLRQIVKKAKLRPICEKNPNSTSFPLSFRDFSF